MSFRVSSSNFILGGKLTDHVVIRPWRGEGRLHIYSIGNVLWGPGGGGGGGGVGSVWGEASPAPPSLDDTLPLACATVLLTYQQLCLMIVILCSFQYFSFAVFNGGPNISAELLGPARLKNMFPQGSKYFRWGPIITGKNGPPSPNIS